MEEHQLNPLDDWTKYGVRLPMFLGGAILLSTASVLILSFTGQVNSSAIPIAISFACIGICLLVEAFFKMDTMKRREAAKNFRSKVIQSHWEEAVKKDRELLDMASNIPNEEIEPDFIILMQAVKQQCAISLINQKLAKEGKQLVPDIMLPENFPTYNTRRKSDYITFFNDDHLFSSRRPFKKSNITNYISMPNLCIKGKSLERSMADPAALTCNAKVHNKYGSKESVVKYPKELVKIPKISFNSRYKALTTQPVKHWSNLESNIFHSSSTSDICSRQKSKMEIPYNKIQSLNTLKDLTEEGVGTYSTGIKRYENEIIFNDVKDSDE